jgi:hypothetical protein
MRKLKTKLASLWLALRPLCTVLVAWVLILGFIAIAASIKAHRDYHPLPLEAILQKNVF